MPLSVNMKEPFNGETPFSILTDSFITPAEIFYVRQVVLFWGNRLMDL